MTDVIGFLFWCIEQMNVTTFIVKKKWVNKKWLCFQSIFMRAISKCTVFVRSQ